MIVNKTNYQGDKTKLSFENLIFSQERFCLMDKLTLKYICLS